MIRAAGVMLLTPTDEVLFLKRSAGSDHPGEWCFPGGVIEAGEDAEEAARREVREEIGPFGYSALTLLTRQIGEVDFTTFLGRVPSQSNPDLSDEHTGWAWAKRTDPPEPLHPGCRIALRRPDMNELDIARVMASGELASPQRYGTFWMFNIRLTATGLAYRGPVKDKAGKVIREEEFVWRDKSLYLNDDFLARAAGTPVIFVHPDKPKLDSEEFNKRIVGVTFLPFIRDDDVWAVSKIYDDATVNWMLREQISTSSGVVFGESSGNQKLKTENGKTLLIEGIPGLWDHIALVPNGVWDKGGPPTGVETLTQESTHVADETEEEKKAREEREDRARKDADRMDRLDAMLTKMDSRMDAMEKEREDRARKDAEEDRERKDRERHDAARKDRFGARKDGEAYKDWKARHDADEMAMMDALEKGGVEKDRARKDAKDCRMDAEEHERKDGGESFEKWAKEEGEEPEHKEDRAKKDAEEKERMEKEEQDRKDAAARHDSQATQIADLQAALKRLTTEIPAGERDALAKAQHRADGVSAMFGERAPTPMAGETSLDYRKRLLKKYQTHSAHFKETRFDGIPGEALGGVEDTVYHDAVVAAKAPATARPGLLMEIVRPDAAGRQIKTYVGDPMAWMAPYMSQGARGRIRRNPNSNEGI